MSDEDDEPYKIGVHRTHCCKLHGCKYRDEDCPVEFGNIVQEYTCEDCGYDGIETVAEIDDYIEIEKLPKVYKEAILDAMVEHAQESADNGKQDPLREVALKWAKRLRKETLRDKQEWWE